VVDDAGFDAVAATDKRLGVDDFWLDILLADISPRIVGSVGVEGEKPTFCGDDDLFAADSRCVDYVADDTLASLTAVVDRRIDHIDPVVEGGGDRLTVVVVDGVGWLAEIGTDPD